MSNSNFDLIEQLIERLSEDEQLEHLAELFEDDDCSTEQLEECLSEIKDRCLNGHALQDDLDGTTDVSDLGWPDRIGEDAYYGVAGDVLSKIKPKTEADPAALLLTFLARFGNLVNPDCYHPISGDKHPLRIYPVLVGNSAKARKGLSWSNVDAVFDRIDSSWKSTVKNGLRTGAGFIHHVRDSEGDDPGVEDKRLTVKEAEFSSILTSMKNSGNTLSRQIRIAWDIGPDGTIANMTKTNPQISTGAHISIIGHITERELNKTISDTQLTNGFGNRLLWTCVKRSDPLPFGGDFEVLDFQDEIDSIHKALNFAEGGCTITWGEDVRSKWKEIYPSLSEAKPGVFGDTIARSEANVARLASIYAVLDCSDEIQKPHLDAALEIWRYCRDSAFYLFGDRIGNELADKIWDILKDNPSGVSRTELSDELSRNKDEEEINEALKVLKDLEKVEVKKESTDGRPKEVIMPK